jgi:hypothetical protein
MIVEIKMKFTSPGDDYDSPDKVQKYTIKYSKFASNLTESTFDDASIPELKDEDLLNGSSLKPVEGGKYVELAIKSDLFESGIVYSFVMRATDDSENKSPLSVIAKLLESGDKCPPSMVTDLQIENSCSNPILKFTSSGDNYNSTDKVQKYTIKYAEILTEDNFDSNIPELTDDDVLNESKLTPVNGGQTVTLELKPSLFENGVVYKLAMKSVDESGNPSTLSNIVELRDACPPSKVGDFEVSLMCNNITMMFTSPGDDADKSSPVMNYTIKFSKDASNLTDNFDDPTLPELTEEDLIEGDTLEPVNGGELVIVSINPKLFEAGTNYSFAVVAMDESGNMSPISNIASDKSCDPAPPNNSDVKSLSMVLLIMVSFAYLVV